MGNINCVTDLSTTYIYAIFTLPIRVLSANILISFLSETKKNKLEMGTLVMIDVASQYMNIKVG